MLNLERFKFRIGQMCGDDLVHNGSWYDGITGEKIGWGDLSPRDLDRAKEELHEGEILVVAGEHDSYWNLPKDLKHENPGMEFLTKFARFVIKKGIVYYVTHQSAEDQDPKRGYRGYPCTIIPQSEVKALLK